MVMNVIRSCENAHISCINGIIGATPFLVAENMFTLEQDTVEFVT